MNFYVNHALVVDKLHRVCGFEQGIWLGVYIEKKTYAQEGCKLLWSKLLQAHEQGMFLQNNEKFEEAVEDNLCPIPSKQKPSLSGQPSSLFKLSSKIWFQCFPKTLRRFGPSHLLQALLFPICPSYYFTNFIAKKWYLDTRQISWKLPTKTPVLSFIKYKLRTSTKTWPLLSTCWNSPTIQKITNCTIQLTKKFP